jgi:DNA modification methylase
MIKLYKGDCLEEMKNIESGSVDAVITDPPYQITACKWDKLIPFDLMWEQLNRIIKPNGAIVLFGSEPFSSALRMSNIKNYKYDNVWNRVRKTGHLNCNKQPLNVHENISVFYSKQCTYNPQKTTGHKSYNKSKYNTEEKYSPNVYGKLHRTDKKNEGERHPTKLVTFSQDWKRQDQIHPTQKPVALMEYLIKTYTNENETVLDFTMGSGSTGVACINTNRNFIGIEQDKKYFEIALERIAAAEKERDKLTLFS